MAIYGMKDAANLIMVDKKTGQPAMYIDYANATSTEWTSEAVFATQKGSNAIRWDGARNGTLTLETETFEFGLLAMVMGSDIAKGRSNIFERLVGKIDKTRKVKIGEAISIDSDTLSVIKLKKDEVEHDGAALYNATTATNNLPAQVKDVTVAVNATTAKVNFPKVATAEAYQVLRDGSVVGTVTTNEFVDTGLTPAKAYEYVIVPTNTFGKGAASAKVVPTTSASGVTDLTQFVATAQAKIDAASNIGEVKPPETGVVTYSYTDGVITFSEEAVPTDVYAIYFMKNVENVRTLTIEANKFPGNFEIFADTKIRPADGTDDIVAQFHYFNAKPQSNFTLTQSATEPTSLSIVFDIMPEKGVLAEFKAID